MKMDNLYNENEKEVVTARSEFLTRISHEVRTPINAITCLAQIASEDIENKEFVLDCLAKTQSSSKYLLSLITDIIDIISVDSNETVLAKNKIDFVTFINSINKTISMKAEKYNIDMSTYCDPSCQKIYEGDEARLKQILMPILDNAIKFNNGGGKIKFYVNQLKEENNCAVMEFIISDTGIGMSEKFLPRAFECFAQETDRADAKTGGCGLGLSVARKFARLMGGDIKAESIMNSGTTVTVTIKLDLFENQPEKLFQNDENNFNRFDFKGKKALLCEDNIINLQVEEKLLENRGFMVECAMNGQKGLEIFSNSEEDFFDVVIIDIRMPVMDGLHLAKKIRSMKRNDAKTVPIIAMTASAYDEDINKSKQAGMNAHISKPIDPKLLYNTLSSYIYGNNKFKD